MSLGVLRSAGSEVALAPAYHRWIVSEWLESGEVARARAVFNDIPEEARNDPRIRPVYERLLDAEEADALGVSVYPAAQRLSARWKRPVVLATQIEGESLSAWYPGYIEEVTATHVVVIIATEPRPERRVIRREVSLAEWKAWAGDLDPTPSTWVYIGRYGERTRIVFNPATAEPPPWREDMILNVSAYLRAWGESPPGAASHGEAG